MSRWVVLTLLAMLSPPLSARDSYPTSDLAAFTLTDRLLIVAPHPDDETLCCGGVIRRALAAQAQVVVVWLTNGDAFEIDAEILERTLKPVPKALRELGMQRMHEAHEAAQRLGIEKRAQFFLGYPDRGLLPLISHYYASSYTSPYTKASTVWYAGVLSPGAAYQGRNLERDLRSVIERVQPTRILAPSPLDQHPDHRAAGDLIMRILQARGESDRARYWIVHGGAHWPAPRGLHPNRLLDAPKHSRSLDWQTVILTNEERNGKLEALKAYNSQLVVIPSSLLAFVRRNELYARQPLPAARGPASP